MSNEEFVRAHWVGVCLDGGSFPLLHKTLNIKDGMSKPVLTYRVLCDHPTMPGAQVILSGNINTPFEKSHHLSESAAWSAAADFTRKQHRPDP